MELQDKRLCEGCAELDLAAILSPHRFETPPVDLRAEEPLVNLPTARPEVDFPDLDPGLASVFARFFSSSGSTDTVNTDDATLASFTQAFRPLPEPDTASEKLDARDGVEYIQRVGRWTPPDAAGSSGTRPLCPLCNLFVEMVSRGHSSYANETKEVAVFPNFLLYNVVDTEATPVSTHLLLTTQRLLGRLADNATFSESRDWLRVSRGHTPYTVAITSPTVPDPSRPTASASIQSLLEHPPSYDIIGSWLAKCAAEHNDKCSPPDGPVVPMLKLIDCRTRRIINTLPSTQYKYVALSYVWGQDPPEPYSYPLLPATLPLVIQDAITFALGLGFHYLWVDRYCIWQDDPVHKMSQVNKMDEIYSGAHFTIIASAGEDPRHGLPGVSASRTSDFQLQATIGQEILLATYFPEEQETQIKASTWRTRGWTLQEEALSRRRLYVTDFQVSFECREMRCLEHLVSPLTLDRNPLMNDLNSLEGIWGTIEEYSRRRLTKHNDRLIAFTGILNQWRRLHPDCFHFWGVPVVAAPQSWRISDHPLADYLRNKFTFTRALLGGLYMWSRSGNKSQIANRDPQFPSWSWVAQGAPVEFLHKYRSSPTGLARTAYEYDAKVWAVRADSTRVEWEEYWSIGRGDFSTTHWAPRLDIEGWVFEVGPFRHRVLRGKDTFGIFWVPAFGDNQEDSGPVKWIREFYPDPLWWTSQTLLRDKFEALAFCPTSKAQFALVLRRVGDSLERVGLLNMSICTIVESGVTETFEYNYEGNETIHAERRIARLV